MEARLPSRGWRQKIVARPGYHCQDRHNCVCTSASQRGFAEDFKSLQQAFRSLQEVQARRFSFWSIVTPSWKASSTDHRPKDSQPIIQRSVSTHPGPQPLPRSKPGGPTPIPIPDQHDHVPRHSLSRPYLQAHLDPACSTLRPGPEPTHLPRLPGRRLEPHVPVPTRTDSTAERMSAV